MADPSLLLHGAFRGLGFHSSINESLANTATQAEVHTDFAALAAVTQALGGSPWFRVHVGHVVSQMEKQHASSPWQHLLALQASVKLRFKEHTPDELSTLCAFGVVVLVALALVIGLAFRFIEEYRLARKLQKVVRGRAARRRVSTEHTCVCEIQRAARGHAARTLRASKEEGVHVIQRAARGRASRRASKESSRPSSSMRSESDVHDAGVTHRMASRGRLASSPLSSPLSGACYLHNGSSRTSSVLSTSLLAQHDAQNTCDADASVEISGIASAALKWPSAPADARGERRTAGCGDSFFGRLRRKRKPDQRLLDATEARDVADRLRHAAVLEAQQKLQLAECEHRAEVAALRQEVRRLKEGSSTSSSPLPRTPRTPSTVQMLTDDEGDCSFSRGVQLNWVRERENERDRASSLSRAYKQAGVGDSDDDTDTESPTLMRQRKLGRARASKESMRI